MKKFSHFVARAEKRKGGHDVLMSLLPRVPGRGSLSKKPDSFYLAEMTRAIFQSGFSWQVIEKKWSGFETVFRGFDPTTLLRLPPEEWDSMASDTRIVRNFKKIQSVQRNASFVRDVSEEYTGFGRYLAAWPTRDLVGLWLELRNRGDRLGGNTGPWFVRRTGKDSFMLTADVVQALQNAGLKIADRPGSKRDLKAVQDAMNQYHEESGWPYGHISRVLAFSVGENYPVERLKSYMG